MRNFSLFGILCTMLAIMRYVDLILQQRDSTKLCLFISTEEACVQLELELETESSVSEEQFDTALRFGVNLEQDSTDVKKYIVAFLQALLLQREKLNLAYWTNTSNQPSKYSGKNSFLFFKTDADNSSMSKAGVCFLLYFVQQPALSSSSKMEFGKRSLPKD